jgi:hypothetical protein
MKGEYDMGLDMYMMHVEKLNDSEAAAINGMHIRDIRDKYKYMCIAKEEFDSDPNMYADLIPLISQVNVIANSFDWKRCWKAYGVDLEDDVVGSMHSFDLVSYSFHSGKSIQMTADEYHEYVYDHEDVYYVWKAKQVAYWRKFYALDEYLQGIRIKCRTEESRKEGKEPTKEDLMMWRTENCGYYLLSAKEKELLNKFLQTQDDDCCGDYHPDWSKLMIDPQSTLMYHAWW